jgi:hypothetical protein
MVKKASPLARMMGQAAGIPATPAAPAAPPFVKGVATPPPKKAPPPKSKPGGGKFGFKKK